MTSEIINKTITKQLIEKVNVVVEELKKDILQKVTNPEIYKTNGDIEKLLVAIPNYIDAPEIAHKMADILGAKASCSNLIIEIDDVRVNFNVSQAFKLLRHYKACLTPLKYGYASSVAWTAKGQYRNIAESLGSAARADEFAMDAINNLATAKNSGNKKMIDLFTREVEKWTEIRDIAHHVDWAAVAREKLVKECLPVQEFITKNHINNADEGQPFLKEYGITIEGEELYKLFETFKIEPVNNDEIIFTMYAANEAKQIIVTDPEVIAAGGETKTIGINEYLDGLKSELTDVKNTFSNSYYTKSGTYKKISHRAARTRFYFEKKIARAEAYINKVSIHIDKIKELNGELIGV